MSNICTICTLRTAYFKIKTFFDSKIIEYKKSSKPILRNTGIAYGLLVEKLEQEYDKYNKPDETLLESETEDFNLVISNENILENSDKLIDYFQKNIIF